MISSIYVKVPGGDEWHLLGRCDGIELRREFMEKEGRNMVVSESYYIELK